MGHKARTRQRILDTATRVLAINPRASLADIAKESQIGRATLHRYFSGRELLIDALVLAAIEETNRAVLPIYTQSELPPLKRLEKIIEAIISLGPHYHFLTFEIGSMQDKDISKRYDDQLKRLQELIIELQQAGEIALDIPAVWVTHSLDALLYAAWTAVREGEVAPKSITQLTLRTLIQGVSSQK